MSDQERVDAVEIALLRKEMEALQADMSEVKGDLRKLANAWATAETLVAFVKWLAGLAAALAVLTGMLKGWFIPKE